MARGDVRDLMRHHPGQLGFGIGGQDQSRVDVKISAGQGVGVDLVGSVHALPAEVERPGHMGATRLARTKHPADLR